MTSPTSASIESLPLELALSIFSILSLNDVKSLSLCSKRSRRLALAAPDFFRTLHINPTSVNAFNSDLGISNLPRGYKVRHLIFTSTNLVEPESIVEYFRLCLSGLHPFVNVTSITINYGFLHYARRIFLAPDKRLIQLIFTSLSKYPFYPNVKALKIVVGNVETDWKRRYGRLSGFSSQNCEFMGINEGGQITYSLGVIGMTPFPPALEEASITTTFESWYHDDHAALFSVIRYGTSTLKKLDLSLMLKSYSPYALKPILLSEGYKPYTALRELVINFDIEEYGYFRKFVKMVPNVETLRFVPGRSLNRRHFLMDYLDDGSEYIMPSICALKNLRKVVLPLPRNCGCEESDCNSLRALGKGVKVWIDAGLDKLEKAIFAKYNQGKHRPKIIIGIECSVLRKEEDWELRWRNVSIPDIYVT
ncbi:hypothetical protein TWF694_003382 [Orbilia ellipsospora]|uniref:F-box domain-containing protein n=1 Tax=Orbilia ellipsospora TaxID=2528407 RepID=A0AAV9WYW6_9PEZI